MGNNILSLAALMGLFALLYGVYELGSTPPTVINQNHITNIFQTPDSIHVNAPAPEVRVEDKPCSDCTVNHE